MEGIRCLIHIFHSSFTHETKMEGSISLLINIWLVRSHPYQIPSEFLPRHTLQRQLRVSSLIIVTIHSGWQRGKPGLSFIVLSVNLHLDVEPQQVLLICLKWAAFKLPAAPRNYKTVTVRDTNLRTLPHPEKKQFSKRLGSRRMQTVLKIPLLKTSVSTRYM